MNKKTGWIMKMVKKEKGKDTIIAWTDMVTYFSCPHCKRMIFMSEPEVTGALRRWRDEAVKAFVKLEKSKKSARKKKS